MTKAAYVILALAVTGVGLTLYLSPELKMRGSGSPAAAEVAFAKIVQGTRTDFDLRENYRIKSSDEISRLWTMLKDATPPPPPVDFTKEDVLAVFAGEVPNPAHTISVTKITDTTEARVVSITITKPGKGCVAAQVIATPYEVVRVPKTSLALTHEDQVVTKDCE